MERTTIKTSVVDEGFGFGLFITDAGMNVAAYRHGYVTTEADAASWKIAAWVLCDETRL
jgi:hypothetical protein